MSTKAKAQTDQERVGLHRKTILLIVAIFLIAFAVRSVRWYLNGWYEDFWDFESRNISISIAEGSGFANPFIIPTGPSAHLAPAYPLLVSGIYRLFGDTTFAQSVRDLLNCAISALQYALMPLMAMVLGMSRRIGIVAGLFGAVLPLQLSTEARGDWESSWTALLMITMLILTRVQWKERAFTLRRSLLMGAGWGISFLFAPQLLPVMCAFLLFGAWVNWADRNRYSLSAVAMLAMIALCLFPWAYRNHRVMGAWIPLRDNLGMELFVSNRDGTTPTLAENFATRRHHAVHPHDNIAAALEVRRMGEVAYNRNKLHAALAWIRQNPLQFASLTASHMEWFWVPLTNYSFKKNVVILLLPALAVLGLMQVFRIDFPGAGLVACVWLFFPLIYYVVQYEPRYRHPMEWSLILFGVQGVTELFALPWSKLVSIHGLKSFRSQAEVG